MLGGDGWIPATMGQFMNSNEASEHLKSSLQISIMCVRLPGGVLSGNAHHNEKHSCYGCCAGSQPPVSHNGAQCPQSLALHEAGAWNCTLEGSAIQMDKHVLLHPNAYSERIMFQHKPLRSRNESTDDINRLFAIHK